MHEAKETKKKSISATSASLPLCGKPNVLMHSMKEMHFEKQ